MDYARLWLALINGHEEDVQKLARKVKKKEKQMCFFPFLVILFGEKKVAGEKSDYKLLASMLTARVWEG